MCGTVGYFSTVDDFSAERFAAANNMVKYRGPDDFGYLTVDRNFTVQEWRDESMRDFAADMKPLGALGFRRLSIIDLTTRGHQPMHEGNREYWIVHNGEVYNYQEIRNELVDRGYTFRSSTDTEVILKSYLEWGNGCLHRFNGMWAFCVLDIPRRRIFCARDRFGIKPFYYYTDGSRFVFGSEVKQLLVLKPNHAKMNRAVFFDYLALGAYGNETRETFFDDIYRILPGEYLEVDLSSNERFHCERQLWWDLPAVDGFQEINSENLYERINYLLEDSIRLRLRSDVQVGTCLSGGLDSSAIVCIVDKIYKETFDQRRHKVFVIGSTDPNIDETSYAQIVIKNTNVEPHIKIPNSIDLASELENFVWHHDEPLISASMFGGWHVYKLARMRDTTVVLDGQGSDELLGGYYFGPHVRFLDDLMRAGYISDFAHQLKSNAHLYQKGRLHILGAVFQSALRRVAHNVLPWNFHPGVYRKADGWLARDFIRNHMGESHVFNKDYYVTRRCFSSFVKRDTYELTRFTNLPGILRQVDRNSMAFSIEARVPFLDHRLVDFLYRLPIKSILRDGYTKYAYRQAMKGVIPEEIRLRVNKQGFTMAERELLSGVPDFVRSVIDRIPDDSNIYDKENIVKQILTSMQNADLYEGIIWRIINAVIWQSRFAVRE
jgi:asparagine synthase (glutamine-hydrolysing)